MEVLLIAIGAGIAFIAAYHTYGKWLGQKIFRLSANYVCPSSRLEDGKDYVPTGKGIVFGHHFTSIAGTGPIVGPAIAVMWGWLPALLWVILGSIFIGAVHDFGSLVVSLRNNGQTVGDIAGRLINKRVRLLFLFVLFLALTIVLAIFGLVIAAVFKLYPASIFPCLIQIPIAMIIGGYLHKKGVNIMIPSIATLVLMYLTVIFGNVGILGQFNSFLAAQPVMTWVVALLLYSYAASVLPVWLLLQPRDYINSLQLISALALIIIGLLATAMIGGNPPVEGAERIPLEIAAPMWDMSPQDAPLIFPFLFITIACGAISGFHCLVSSGTSSKQLKHEPDARFVGYGGMLTEGFLATLVILACVAGLGLGIQSKQQGLWAAPPSLTNNQGEEVRITSDGEKIIYGDQNAESFASQGIYAHGAHSAEGANYFYLTQTGQSAWKTRYASWNSAKGLGAKVGAFVDGSANFLKTLGIPSGVAIALMAVLVASFAGTTLDSACRLQRYVVQELASTFLPKQKARDCPDCGYDLSQNVSGNCPECGWEIDWDSPKAKAATNRADTHGFGPLSLLANKHGATLFAITLAGIMAALPAPGTAFSDLTWASAGKGGLILWPLFGATNQLLGGLAFTVIAFYLWRRGKPVWFVVLPMIFMLCMPVLAMGYQIFFKAIGSEQSWIEQKNWLLVALGMATILLEIWMIIEAILLFPKVKGESESLLAGNEADPIIAQKAAPA